MMKIVYLTEADLAVRLLKDDCDNPEAWDRLDVLKEFMHFQEDTISDLRLELQKCNHEYTHLEKRLEETIADLRAKCSDLKRVLSTLGSLDEL